MSLHRGRRQLIATDTVFSMDGDLAPLAALHALATERKAGLLVDEAHAVGVLGPSGAGLVEGLKLSADVRMGTLGKALGSFGAFVGSSAATREWLFNKARSLVFSTALPPVVCAAASEALRVVRSDVGLRVKLWRNIERFAAGLRRLLIPAHGSSAIFSVVYGAPERALEASRQLRRRGILAKAIRPPTVPEGTSRVRFALTAGHTEAQVDKALEALEELKVKHGLTRAA
jgi:8-amino-7-oxononanoate synthase